MFDGNIFTAPAIHYSFADPQFLLFRMLEPGPGLLKRTK